MFLFKRISKILTVPLVILRNRIYNEQGIVIAFLICEVCSTIIFFKGMTQNNEGMLPVATQEAEAWVT